MKYRIKIEHLNNGAKHHYPQVKKHLLGFWYNIMGDTTSLSRRCGYISEQDANESIANYKSHLNEEWGWKVKSISYITIWW